MKALTDRRLNLADEACHGLIASNRAQLLTNPGDEQFSLSSVRAFWHLQANNRQAGHSIPDPATSSTGALRSIRPAIASAITDTIVW